MRTTLRVAEHCQGTAREGSYIAAVNHAVRDSLRAAGIHGEDRRVSPANIAARVEHGGEQCRFAKHARQVVLLQRGVVEEQQRATSVCSVVGFHLARLAQQRIDFDNFKC